MGVPRPRKSDSYIQDSLSCILIWFTLACQDAGWHLMVQQRCAWTPYYEIFHPYTIILGDGRGQDYWSDATYFRHFSSIVPENSVYRTILLAVILNLPDSTGGLIVITRPFYIKRMFIGKG